MKSHDTTINSVNVNWDIITALKELNQPGITELATELDYAKSTIFNHLHTLQENEVVVKDGEKYRLSARFLGIAEEVKNQVCNYQAIKEELDELADQTEEVAQFGIEEHGKIRYLYKAKGSKGVDAASSIGGQLPLHSTALGKVILAHLSDERVDEIIENQGLSEKTEHTITDRTSLDEEMEIIRERGYALDREESTIGLKCVSVPVMDNDEILGALSVSGPSSRFSETRIEEEILDLLQNASNVIELDLQFS